MNATLETITKTDRPDFDFDQRAGAEVMENMRGHESRGFGISLEHGGLGPAGAVLVIFWDVLKESR